MKKERVKMNIKINLTNKWFYTFIAIGILIVVGIGVYALAPGVIPTPGHNYTELATCAEGEILKTVGGVWTCASATQCSSSLKDCENIAVTSSTSSPGTWTTCPSGKMMTGIRVWYYEWGIEDRYYKTTYMKCCNVSVSCN